MSTNKSNNILSQKDREQILTKFGLKFEEKEKFVYKIININKEIDIEELQLELKLCALLISANYHYKKSTKDNLKHTISGIYYAIIGSDNRELYDKYYLIAKEEYRKTILQCYEHHENYTPSIDTIYAKEK